MADHPEKTKQKARRTGQVVARGEGKWVVRVFLGRGLDGTRRYHNHTIRGTKKDAEKYLRGVQLKLDLGEFAERDPIVCRDFLKKWMSTAVEPRVRPRSFVLYQQTLDRYILPVLGNQRLRDVRPLDIQTLYSDLQARGLQGTTLRVLHALLTSSFKQAMRWGLLTQNPLTHIDPPRIEKREMQALTISQARDFLEKAESTRYHALFTFMLASGCRPSEALGLKWSDVDSQAATVSIVRALYWRKGGWEITEPKTKASRRTIPVGPAVIGILVEYRRRQAEEQLRAGAAWKGTGFVFTKTTGQPLDLGTVKAAFKSLLKASALPSSIRVYDLRHSCASILMSQGLNPKVVSERLGHSNVSLTLATYSHVAKGLQESASERIENALFG